MKLVFLLKWFQITILNVDHKNITVLHSLYFTLTESIKGLYYLYVIFIIRQLLIFYIAVKLKILSFCEEPDKFVYDTNHDILIV